MSVISGDYGYLKPGMKIWHPSEDKLVVVKSISSTGGLDTDVVFKCWCGGRNFRIDFEEDVPGVSFCSRHFDFDWSPQQG
jgi:hypothetical protein